MSEERLIPASAMAYAPTIDRVVEIDLDTINSFSAWMQADTPLHIPSVRDVNKVQGA